MPRVAVVLVNWNKYQDTLECIESINSSTYQDIQIIVVDNGSTNNSLEILRKLGQAIVLIDASDNFGFTGGNNIGIREALKSNAEFIYILNNDTIIASDSIEILVNSFNHKDIGVACPKILFHSDPEKIWFGGAHFSPLTLSAKMVGYKKIDNAYDSELSIPFGSGCAMLVKREVFTYVKGFNDDYFAVMEDVDFSRKVISAGFKIKFVPKSVIWHKESISAGGRDAPLYVYYQTRNELLFVSYWKKNFLHLLFAYCFHIIYIFKRFLGYLIRKHFSGILGLILGTKDGLCRVTGKIESGILR